MGRGLVIETGRVTDRLVTEDVGGNLAARRHPILAARRDRGIRGQDSGGWVAGMPRAPWDELDKKPLPARSKQHPWTMLPLKLVAYETRTQDDRISGAVGHFVAE